MAPPSAWFDSQMAYTTKELEDGDGCHPHEAQALSDYLHGISSSHETATKITAAILNEKTPSEELYRLWGLLCEALVELSVEDRHKTMDLLLQIQALSPTLGIEWSQLPGFGNMWADLYHLHLQGSCGPGIFDKTKEDELRREYDAIGRAEAEMMLRGFDVVLNEDWGYYVLNLVHSERPELEILMSEVFAWLEVAGWKLKEKAMGENTLQRCFYTLGGGRNQHNGVERTLTEHWTYWKEAIHKISEGETGLSEVARGLATRCLELM